METIQTTQPLLFEQWKIEFLEECYVLLRSICEKFGVQFTEEGAQKYYADKVDSASKILEHGLDIGSIVKFTILVTLTKHDVHGWCFHNDTHGLYPLGHKI